jgi:hypothetical protein
MNYRLDDIRRMNAMAKILIQLLVLALVFVDPTFATKKKRIVLKPKHSGQQVVITVGDKSRAYYPLSAEQPSVVEVKGPGELHIITRARLEPDATAEVAYGLLYKIDGAEQQAFDVEGVESSPDASYKGAARGSPGDAEELTLNIGRGRHTIELLLRHPAPEVSARYLFSPHKQKKTKWIAMSPLAPVEPVDLYAGEQTLHCYRFSKDKPLKVEIIGPTEVRVLTRVENSFSMKGRASYRVQVRQGPEVIQSYQLSSRRSETTLYKDNAKLVPGSVREIVFTVPKGKHRYEIISLDNHTILGQVLFPQKDAKLGL